MKNPKTFVIISKNKFTTNIIIFNKAKFASYLHRALYTTDAMTKEDQDEYLARSMTSYEVNNEHLETFMHYLETLNIDMEILVLDKNKPQTLSFDVSERTGVSLTPILIPLHDINASKPPHEAVIVHTSINDRIIPGKSTISGKYLRGGKAILAANPQTPNNIGIIFNGAQLVRGESYGARESSRTRDEDYGPSM